MNRIYIVDIKLMSYNELQRGSTIGNIFNTLARDLISLKKRGTIYVTFDIGHSSFREGEQSYYKAHRRTHFAKQPQEVQDKHKQFNLDYLKLVRLFSLLGVTVVAVTGVEADDLASLVALRHTKDEVVLLSADKDWLHSVVGTDNVTMYSGREYKSFGHDYVVEQYGTTTREQFTNLKVLLGDEGDNLKAFRNMGPVKTKTLFDILYTEPVTRERLIKVTEDYLKVNPRIKIHELHTEAGRDTVEKVIDSNTKVAATFTDLSNMMDEQKEEYHRCFEEKEQNTSDEVFQQACIEELGYPIFLTDQAKKVYNVT